MFILIKRLGMEKFRSKKELAFRLSTFAVNNFSMQKSIIINAMKLFAVYCLSGGPGLRRNRGF